MGQLYDPHYAAVAQFERALAAVEAGGLPMSASSAMPGTSCRLRAGAGTGSYGVSAGSNRAFRAWHGALRAGHCGNAEARAPAPGCAEVRPAVGGARLRSRNRAGRDDRRNILPGERQWRTFFSLSVRFFLRSPAIRRYVRSIRSEVTIEGIGPGGRTGRIDLLLDSWLAIEPAGEEFHDPVADRKRNAALVRMGYRARVHHRRKICSQADEKFLRWRTGRVSSSDQAPGARCANASAGGQDREPGMAG